MRKIVSVLAMWLMIAIAIGAIACAEKLPPTPTVTPLPTPTPVPEPPVPSDFATYTDDANKFSISYPSDWNHGADLVGISYPTPSTERHSVFTAARITEGQAQCSGPELLWGYNPRIDVEVGPRPEGAETLDAVLEAENRGIGSGTVLLDYHEFSRVKTTIDGKEVAIIEYEAHFASSCTPLGQDHYLQMLIPWGNNIWIVTCTTWAEWYSDFEDTFYHVLESFRILELLSCVGGHGMPCPYGLESA
jgi:hypothetical protein